MENNESEIITLMFQRTNHRSTREPGKTSADCHQTGQISTTATDGLIKKCECNFTKTKNPRSMRKSIFFFFVCHGLWKPPRRAPFCRRDSGHWILDKINICNILVVARYRNGSDQLCIWHRLIKAFLSRPNQLWCKWPFT